MTTITDTYTYTQSPLSGNYITYTDKGLQSTTTGANAVPGAIRDNGSCYNPTVYQFLPAHSSEITFENVPGNFDWPGVGVACAATGGTAGGGQGYIAYYEPEGSDVAVFVLSATIANSISGSGSYILLIPSTTFTTGDRLKLAIASGVLTVYKNGTSIGTVSDSTYTNGQPGLAYEDGNSNATKISAWSGVDAFTPPSGSAVPVSNTVIFMGSYPY